MNKQIEDLKRHAHFDQRKTESLEHTTTWQSLSDDNILKLFKPKFECEIEDFELIDFSRAIEQALKEKNHG